MTPKNFAARLAAFAPGADAFAACVAKAPDCWLQPAEGVGLDGVDALRLWRDGRATVDVACTAVRHCTDPEVLAVMARDKRATVLRVLAGNPHVMFATAQLIWTRTPQSDSTRHAAVDAMLRNVGALTRAEVVSWLSVPNDPRVMSALVCHPELNDADLVAVCVPGGDPRSNYHHPATSIMKRDDIAERSDLVILEVFRIYPAAVTGHDELGRRPCVVEAILGILTVEENANVVMDLARKLAAHTGLDADVYRRLATLTDRLGNPLGADISQVLAENAAVPSDVLESMAYTPNLVGAVGRVLAERAGDDGAVWAAVLSVADDWTGTVGDLVDGCIVLQRSGVNA